MRSFSAIAFAITAFWWGCGAGLIAGPTSSTIATSGGGARPADSHLISSKIQTVPLKIKLPFPAGQTYQVIQGNHGDFTHTGFNEYAWDFGLPMNSPVCAAAAGRVVRVKQDGVSGGPSDEYFGEGNTIVIDHGAGYYSQYLHLAPHSAIVKEGDLVLAGQTIARSGDTGFSSTPHLHFHVQDASGRSLPVKFQDVPGDGIPRAGMRVTSGNDGRGATQYAGESFLPPDIFKPNSIILLTRNLPGHLFRANHDYEVTGRFTGDAAQKVALYFMSASGGSALYTVYANVDPDGFFTAEFDPENLKRSQTKWSGSLGQSNMFSLAVAPVKADGSFWSDISVPICVR